MPSLFDTITETMAGSNVSLDLSTQAGHLSGLGTTVSGLINNPPGGLQALEQALRELRLPDFKIEGNFAATLGNLEGALPTDLSTLTGSLTSGLDELQEGVASDLTGVLQNALEAATAIYNLTQIDLRCEDAGAAVPAAGAGASAGTGAGGAGAASGAGASTGAGTSPSGTVTSGTAAQGAAARVAAIEQVNAMLALMPSPFNVENFLLSLHAATEIPQRASVLPFSIPLFDDLRDPLETLLKWKAMPPAQILDHIADTLAAAALFIRSGADATLNPLFADIAALAGQLRVDDLMRIADALIARLNELRDAARANNLQTKGAAIAALNASLQEYETVRDTLQPGVLAQLPALNDRLQALPDELEEQMSHTLAVLQPNNVIGQLEPVLRVADDTANLAAVAAFEQSLGTIVVWLDDLAEKIDLSAIKEPLKAVADETQAAVDALDNGVVTLTLEVQNLFGQLESLLDEVDIAAVVAQVEDAIEGFRDELIGQLSNLFAPVREAIGVVVTNITQATDSFNPQAIIDSLNGAIDALAGVFTDSSIGAALVELRGKLDKISEQVGSLSFEAVTDEVVKAIEEVTGTLQSISATQLAPPLQMALQTALEVLPADLHPITEPIITEFEGIIAAGPITLLESVQLQPQLVLDAVNQFQPAALLGDGIMQPFRDVLAQMEGFRPSRLLEPVEAELEKLKDRLRENANPGQVLAPLEAPFNSLLEAFDRLRPGDLVKPLEDIIKNVSDAIFDVIPVDATFEQIDAALGSVEEVVGLGGHTVATLNRLHDMLEGLTGGEAQINTWISAILDKVGAMGDAAALQPRWTALAQALDGTKATALGARFDGAVAPVLAPLAALDAQARLTALVQSYRGCRQALEAVGSSPEKSALTAALDLFNPMHVSFSAPYQALDRWRGELAATRTSLQEVLSDWDARFHPADGILGGLRQGNPTAAQLRQWVEDALGPHFVRPFGLLFNQAQALGRNLNVYLTLLERLVTTLQNKLAGVLLGPDSLLGIRDSLKELVERLRNFDLGFLRESLEELFAGVRAKLEALNPARLRETLEQAFDAMLDSLSVGQIIPAADVAALDADYAEVIAKLRTLDPEQMLKSLQQKFEEKIMPLIEALDITPVLKALVAHLERLAPELRAGLDKVNEAYRALREAVPEGGLGASASVDISF